MGLQSRLFIFCTLLLVLLWGKQSQAQFSIPGVGGTINGYDNEYGEDPMCWLSLVNSTITTGVGFSNPLIEELSFLEDVELLLECPTGLDITVNVPSFERFRTGTIYNYTIDFSLNLASLAGNSVLSDKGSQISVQILLCVVGRGFCSPFVHEQAYFYELWTTNTVGSTSPGDLHGGSHIHSNYTFVDVSDTSDTLHFVKDIEMLVNEPNDYFVVGAIQLFTSEDGTNAQYRYDASNMAETRVVTYQLPAEIKKVSMGLLGFSYLIIAMGVLVLSAFLVELLRHRCNQILHLCQVKFLIATVVFAIISTTSAFLVSPQNDIYCRISPMLIALPLHCHFSISFGRLWRIHRVLSPLLVTRLRKASQRSFWSTGLVNSIWERWSTFGRWGCGRFCAKREKSLSRNVRRTVREKELAGVIALFCIPQILVQILAITLQPRKRMIEYNDDESIGIPYCSSGYSFWADIVSYGYIVFLLLIIGLLTMAYNSRKLPSLFNETEILFGSTLTSFFLVAIDIMINIIADADLEARYIVSVVVIVTLNLNVVLRQLIPKMLMVWRKERVIVSSLVSDHKEKEMEREKKRRMKKNSQTGKSWISLYNVTGFTPKRKSGKSAESPQEQEQEHKVPPPPPPTTPTPPPCVATSKIESESENHRRGSLGLASAKGPQLNQSIITISDNQTPSRLFVLRMIELKLQMENVIDRITTGVVVPHDAWEELRKANRELSEKFTGEVRFEWENDDDDDDDDEGDDEFI